MFVWNSAEGLNVSKSKPFAVCPFATCELQFGSIKKRSKHLAPFNCCDHAVLAYPCRSDVWSLQRQVMKSVNLQILHVFALLCCVLLYFRGNLDFCVISDRHLAWCSCALFRFLFQVQRAEEIYLLYIYIYQMGWLALNIIIYNILLIKGRLEQNSELRSFKTNEIGHRWNRSTVQSRNSSVKE